MGRFTADNLHTVMGRVHNIRNVSVIGPFKHGKTTLIDSLVSAAGLILQEVAGEVRMMDTRDDEVDSGMSIKANAISLYYDMTDESLHGYIGERMGSEYLLNLIDSPGHIELSSETTASLRLTDGAVVVVDCNGGLAAQTERVLHQALADGVCPVLAFNKLDRYFFSLQVDGEQAYQTFLQEIDKANDILGTYGELQLQPDTGDVVFSSGLHGWGFTLSTFARIYAPRFRKDEHEEVMGRELLRSKY